MHDIRPWTPQRAQVLPLSIARWKTLLLRVFQGKCYRYVHTDMAVVHTCCRSPAYSRLCKLWDGCYLPIHGFGADIFFLVHYTLQALDPLQPREFFPVRDWLEDYNHRRSPSDFSPDAAIKWTKNSNPKSSFQELKTRVPINFTLRYSLNYWRSLPLWSFRLSRHF